MACGLRMPAWDCRDPKLFFIKSEIIFDANGINDPKQKYALCLASLDANAISAVKQMGDRETKDLLKKKNIYEALRSELLIRYRRDKLECVRDALEMRCITDGDMRPSIWVDVLESVLDGVNIEDVKWYLFLKQIPECFYSKIDRSKGLFGAAADIDFYFTMYGNFVAKLE